MLINATGHNRADKTIELLWENNDPTSGFASQPLMLNTGHYTMLYIVYKIAPSVDKTCIITCPTKSYDARYKITAFNEKTSYSRSFSVNDDFIDFGRGSYVTHSSTSPSSGVGSGSIIPYRIYGGY